MNDDLTQAERMLRRVSPEGRAQAQREAAAKASARNTVVFATLAAMMLLVAMVLLGAPISALAVTLLLSSLVLVMVALQMRPEPVTAEILVRRTPLPQLPAKANAWLAGQRKALPAPAVQLTDTLGRRLEDLAPQLERLSPDEPAADAVRKLLAHELPELVDRYRAVPRSLRADPRPDGRTADAHLVEGLTLIDEEVARMTEQLARGALDEVATQSRYLQLKYDG